MTKTYFLSPSSLRAAKSMRKGKKSVGNTHDPSDSLESGINDSKQSGVNSTAVAKRSKEHRGKKFPQETDDPEASTNSKVASDDPSVNAKAKVSSEEADWDDLRVTDLIQIAHQQATDSASVVSDSASKLSPNLLGSHYSRERFAQKRRSGFGEDEDAEENIESNPLRQRLQSALDNQGGDVRTPLGGLGSNKRSRSLREKMKSERSKLRRDTLLMADEQNRSLGSGRDKFDRNQGGLSQIHLPEGGTRGDPTNDPGSGGDPDTLVERLPHAESPDLTLRKALESWEATLRERERRLDHQEALRTHRRDERAAFIAAAVAKAQIRLPRFFKGRRATWDDKDRLRMWKKKITLERVREMPDQVIKRFLIRFGGSEYKPLDEDDEADNESIHSDSDDSSTDSSPSSSDDLPSDDPPSSDRSDDDSYTSSSSDDRRHRKRIRNFAETANSITLNQAGSFRHLFTDPLPHQPLPANTRAIFQQSVHTTWPHQVQQYRAKGGRITSWMLVFGPRGMDFIIQELYTALRTPKGLKTPWEIYPEFFVPGDTPGDFLQRDPERLKNPQKFRWDRIKGRKSPWPILQRLFPAISTAAANEAKRAQAISQAVQNVPLTRPVMGTRLDSFLQDVDTAIRKTSTGEQDTLANVSVEASQSWSAAFVSRLQRATSDKSLSTNDKLWVQTMMTDLLNPSNTFFKPFDFQGTDGVKYKYPSIRALCSWHHHYQQQKYDLFVVQASELGYTYGVSSTSHDSEGGQRALSKSKMKAMLRKESWKAKTTKEATTTPVTTTHVAATVGTTAGSNPTEPKLKCDGCGRNAPATRGGHASTACPFKKTDNRFGKPHPGHNRAGTWETSDSFRNLQRINAPNGKPYQVLQYEREAKQIDGVWKFVKIEAGPENPNKANATKPKVHNQKSLRPTGSNRLIDITSAFSLLCRSDRNLQGYLGDVDTSVLIDTGATEFNFADRSYVIKNKLPLYTLPNRIRVRSVHDTSTVCQYTIVPLTIKFGNESLELSIPCLILESSPRDVILGLPAITQYDILNRFKTYFEEKGKELAEQQRRLFPHLDTVSVMNGPQSRPYIRENGQTLMSTTLTSVSYPYARAPILDSTPATSRLDTPEVVSPHTQRDNSFKASGQTLMSHTSHPPPTYTVQHRDELLDTAVEPDSDSIPVTDEPPDPVAKEPEHPSPEDEPKLFGSPQLQRKLRRLIAKHKSVFATQLPREAAHITPISFNIDTAGWKADKRSKQYTRPLSHDKEIALGQWIAAALESGIISEAPAVPNWSQILLVLKPNGKEYRFCVDYTVLNTFMESAGWPIPHISSILRRIASHRPKYFATMDSTQGFYQMEVEMSSREFLCFTTYLGNYMWNRAPMGPKTVPALFQRAMCVEVFPDLIHKIMEVYIDDFIVWAQSEDELITRLDEVFTRLSEKNLKLNPRKCRFGMTEVEYCGHVINDQGTTFSKERISEVHDFAVPQTHGELKSFLGMAGYMREHVPHYVEIVHPLQKIVSHYKKRTRRQAIEWTPELLEAFQSLKDAIANVYTLFHRDEASPLRLYTDASSYGIGAYLCQVVTLTDGTIQEQPLGFISKSLTDTERRWSVYEKEGYAIFYACKKWEHFLRGNHFHLFTDHKNLTFLNRPPSEKVMRWRLAIQEYDFSVAYIKGETNNVADALSRCVPSPKDLITTDSPNPKVNNRKPRPTTLDYLSGSIVDQGPRLSDVPPIWYEILEAKHIPQLFIPSEEIDQFLGLLDGQIVTEPPCINNTGRFAQLSSGCLPQLRNTLLYSLCCPVDTNPTHELAQHEALSLPMEIRELIQCCHNTQVGHGGVDRTLALLEQLRQKDPSKEALFAGWKFKRADVRRFVRTCPICQKIKQHQLLKYTPHFTTSTYGIFDNISIDTVYMPESSRGNKYLIVVIDSFSRYLDLFPVAELSAKTAMVCLIMFMSNFGIPSHICCDNGSQFQGLFQELIDLLTVNGYKTHPYSHQENSIVERANKEILTTLRALVLERRLKNDWDILCHVAKRIINSRIHSAIGIAPADLVFAGRIDLQRGSLFPYPTPKSFEGSDYMHTLMQHQEEMLNKAIKCQRAHDMARLKDNMHALKTIFPINSYVLVKPETEPSDKLAPRWLGPYLITERFERKEGDVYRCLHLSTNKEFDFRVDRLDPYYTYDETSLHETATLDNEQYEVESIIRHRFNGSQSATNLQLDVKWLGYDQTGWQPYIGNGLNEVGTVHDYLRQNKLARFIPSKFR
jgi:hypothetical protein